MRAGKSIPRSRHHHPDPRSRRPLLLRGAMTIDTAVGDVLARLSDAQVEALAAASRGQQRPTWSLAHVAAGASPGAYGAVAALSAAWASSPALTGDGVSLALISARGPIAPASERPTTCPA